MSRKTWFQKINLVNQAVSANFTGPVSDIRTVDRVFYQLGITGNVQGNLSIQVCADYDPANPANFPGTWIELQALPAIGGVAQTYPVDVQQTAAPFMRVALVNYASGTGTLTAHVFGRSSG